jgi:hypothetical protein
MWWKKAPIRPNSPVTYPDGVAVEVEDNTYYVKSGKLYRLYSFRVIDSWRFTPLIGSNASIANYKVAGSLGFRDGTLVRDISSARLYLIAGNKRRLITSPDVFEVLGLNRSGLIDVSEAEINLHDEGEPLD